MMRKRSVGLYICAGVLGLLAALGVVSCYGNDFVTTDGDVKVLENPFPLALSDLKTYANPPATLPTNRVLAVLKQGEKLEIHGRKYGKDFLAYEVQLTDGRRGYVIHGDNFHVTHSRSY